MDLLLSGGLVITQDDDRAARRTSVAVSGNRIAGLGDPAALEAEFGPPAKVIDAPGRVVMPGLVNAHTHLFQAGLRGLGGGRSLADWHAAVMVPAYEAMTAQDAYLFTLVGAIENLRSGVTAVANVQAFPNDLEACALVARAVGETGLRAQLGKSLYGRGPDGHLELLDPGYLADTERVFADLHGSHGGRIRFAVTPPRATRAPADAIVAAHRVAAAAGSGIHTHVAETRPDADAAREALGMSEVAWFDALGVLDERFQAAHCVAVSEADAAVLAARGAAAIHCPVSNMYLGSGVADLAQLEAAGLAVALGTDGPASNDNQDMVGAMKAAALLQRATRHDATAIPPGTALDMATRNGARALGVEAGSIAPGRLADLVVLDLSGPHHQPLHRPISSIVHAAHADDVETVIVDGAVVLDRRRIVGVDEEQVLARASWAAEALVERAGLDVAGTWPWA
ncbi:MAG: amidohydrolase family protein [Candidatus Limnocylindria bacterium]